MLRGFRPREMRSLHGDTVSKVDIPVAMASIERVRRGPIVRGVTTASSFKSQNRVLEA